MFYVYKKVDKNMKNTYMQLGTVCRTWLSWQFHEYINIETLERSVLFLSSFIAKQVL